MSSSHAREMRAYRRNHPEYVEEDRRRTNARNRAKARLAFIHFEEFEKLYREELDKS